MFAQVVTALGECLATRYTAYGQNLWRAAAKGFCEVVASGVTDDLYRSISCAPALESYISSGGAASWSCSPHFSLHPHVLCSKGSHLTFWSEAAEAISRGPSLLLQVCLLSTLRMSTEMG